MEEERPGRSMDKKRDVKKSESGRRLEEGTQSWSKYYGRRETRKKHGQEERCQEERKRKTFGRRHSKLEQILWKKRDPEEAWTRREMSRRAKAEDVWKKALKAGANIMEEERPGRSMDKKRDVKKSESG